LESKHAPLQRAIIRVIGSITRPVPRHELFDLADRTALCDFEPCPLVFGCRHPRELANDRPARDAVPKRVLELGQTLKRLRDPQPFLGRASAIAEESFYVLAEATESQVQVRPRAKSVEQRLPLLPIEPGASLREPR
jgi:hypothetical protein